MDKMITNIDLDNDKSINSKVNDLFGYANYARKWASIIYSVSESGQNYVFSIEGKWGSGKSSMIELLYEEFMSIEQNKLNSRIKVHGEKKYLLSSPSDSEVLIENFNPWKYSDFDSLLIEFFKTLKRGTEIENNYTSYQAFKNLVKLSLPLLSITSNPFFTAISKVGEKFLDSELNLDTLEDSFKVIYDYFDSNKIRKIIIIDDIERLEDREALQIFKLVKTISALPGVVFILVFDGDKINALKENNDWLDKIIQHRFNLPYISERSLQNYFFDEIYSITKLHSFPNPEEVLNDLNLLYNSGIEWKSILQTVRGCKRLLNAIKISINESDFGVINFVDLICITILNHFDPVESITILSKGGNYLTANLEGLNVAPNLKPVFNFLLSERDSKCCYLKYPNGGPYINQEYRIASILLDLRKSQNPHFEELDFISTSSNYRFDISDIINIVLSHEFSPDRIALPALYSYRLIIKLAKYFENSDSIYNFNIHRIFQWYRKCLLMSLDKSDTSLSIINEEFYFTHELTEVYAYCIQEDFSQYSKEYSKFFSNQFIDYKERILKEFLDLFLTQIKSNNFKLIADNKILITALMRLDREGILLSYFRDEGFNIKLKYISLIVWAGKGFHGETNKFFDLLSPFFASLPITDPLWINDAIRSIERVYDNGGGLEDAVDTLRRYSEVNSIDIS